MKFYSSFPITAYHCLNNRAMAYGDGLFETLLMVRGQLPFWQWHYQRLVSGLRQLNILPPDEKFLLEKIQTLTVNDESCCVKLVVFRDDEKRGYTSRSQQCQFYITINKHTPTLVNSTLGISEVCLSEQKKMAGLKHLNRLEQVLAAQSLITTGYQDALMVTKNKYVIETISKNIVLIKNDKLFTPKLNNSGVYGVALRWLQQSYALHFKKIKLKDLGNYQGFMVCNSLSGFNAITNIENQFHFEANLSIITEIQSLWEKQLDQ